jgi:FMN reductase
VPVSDPGWCACSGRPTFAGGTLEGIVAVPLMLGAGPGHALAPEVFLKPVLAELGRCATLPGSA